MGIALLPPPMLTGHNRHTAEAIARQVSINDTPALARADIGSALGAAGADTAIETAELALMNDDPRKLAEFVELSRATRAVLWQNIALARRYQGGFPLAGTYRRGDAVDGGVRRFGGNLLVVFNGLRLLPRAR